MQTVNHDNVQNIVEQVVQRTPVTDVHTHIFPEVFGDLLLWGVDELLTYHYLIAELFRYRTQSYEDFFALSKTEQSDLIWETLFVQHSPVSEAQRGVLTVLKRLGLDVATRDLAAFRKYFAAMSTKQYIDKVMETANVKEVVMTNDPFDPVEKSFWDKGGYSDNRFKAALRVDPLLNSYEDSCSKLQEWGYRVSRDLDEVSVQEVRRFLKDWIKKMDALYMAVSLPPTYTVPEDSLRSRIVEQCIIPVCRELNIPFAMMIGVKKLSNYKLGLAGDSLGKSGIETVEYLCRTYPQNKFMVTMLSREDQHELAITARKFGNLIIFGCWWFLNNPVIIEDMTRMRLETLGLSFIPQHSDARVLDQLIYKWTHSRKIIARVLADKYRDLLDTGWTLTEAEIERDVADLMGGTFWKFIEK
ncbi:MAG TPA: glucuronate isomerase [Patescibacteria group bacterium]|nr:glucuronate isomerase [Patescibacteria group bacterium]